MNQAGHAHKHHRNPKANPPMKLAPLPLTSAITGALALICLIIVITTHSLDLWFLAFAGLIVFILIAAGAGIAHMVTKNKTNGGTR